MLDVLAGEVDVQLLDPTGHPRVDVIDPRLVGDDGADRPHRPRQRPAHDRRGLHAGEAHALGGHLDAGEPGDSSGRAGLLVGVHRHVVHPHRVLHRHRRGDRRVHRVAVEEHLPPDRRGPWAVGRGPIALGNGGGGAPVPGPRSPVPGLLQRHAALRAASRLVRRHLGVHRADVRRGGRRRDLLLHRHQPHAADRAVARLVRDVGRVHRAVIPLHDGMPPRPAGGQAQAGDHEQHQQRDCRGLDDLPSFHCTPPVLSSAPPGSPRSAWSPAQTAKRSASRPASAVLASSQLLKSSITVEKSPRPAR